jgi:hypothetical protein
VNSRIIIVVVLTCVVLSACGGQAPTEAPTLDANAIMTAGVGTFIANMYQTQTAQAALVANTVTPAVTSSPISLNTPTPPPTWTPGPVFNPVLPTIFISPIATGTQYTPTANSALLASGCNNLRLIRDESIPDGTVVKPGESFTKIWKVENSGTCNWMFLYRLVSIGGALMGGEPKGLGKIIVPGKWTDISITFTAPSKGGKYTGTWRMGTQSGTPFGSTLTVSIVVGNPTDTPQPTSPATATATATATNTATSTSPAYPNP